MDENLKEIFIGDGYGEEGADMVEWLIIPRVEAFSDNQADIQAKYMSFSSKHSTNPILLEVLSEWDPTSLVEDERWNAHKQFIFELLYMREVRGINPLPTEHANYSYTVNAWYVGYDELISIIAHYLGELSVSEALCKKIAKEFNQFRQKLEDGTINLNDESAADPYYKEIYDIYLQLMNDMYEIGNMDLKSLKRFVFFLRNNQEALSVFLGNYLSDDYDRDEEPAYVRVNKEYQQTVGNLIHLFDQHFLTQQCGIDYYKTEIKLLKEVWYKKRSASDVIVYVAVREHAILQCIDELMTKISHWRNKDIDSCLERIKRFDPEINFFWPFLQPIEKLMQKNHPYLRNIYCSAYH